MINDKVHYAVSENDTHPKMNQEQYDVLHKVLEGNNVFITGPAGTGKTFVLRNIIHQLKQLGRHIGVTASTGLAACHINGRTLHSFMGIGLGTKDAKSYARSIKDNKSLFKRLKTLQSLIIDEISQVDASLFDKVSQILGIIRDKPHTAFGGVQVILCGDFCQLPPVKGEFCFEADAWSTSNIVICHLSEMMRQKHDSCLQEILSETRWGVCKDEFMDVLKQMCETDFPQYIQPTILYAKNVDVDAINEKELKNLQEMSETFTYHTHYAAHPTAMNWGTSLRIPTSFQCCVGAQVMVTHNSTVDPSIVNGSRGIVIECKCDTVVVKLVNGRTVNVEYATIRHEDCEDVWIKFMPLRLAYAITIHKSQGMTLDAVQMDLGSNIFEYGQAYTALSRARSLKNVKITAVDERSFRTHPRVKEFYKNVTTNQNV